MDLSEEQRRFFRDQLREARAQALMDSEGFYPILSALERLGALLMPEALGLGRLRDALVPLALTAPSCWAEYGRRNDAEIDSLFSAVLEGRNDALHHGAFARHLTTHCVQLALLVEEGLMAEARLVRDFMVREPSCAQPWQPLSLARHRMLTNSFSYLPIHLDGAWWFISDYAIASHVANAENRRKALAEPIETLCSSGALRLESAALVPPESTIQEALQVSMGKPVLVVHEGHLLGIATPFDLL